jgi:hypothetical protein
MIIVSTTTETLYYLWHKITNTIPIKIHAFMYNKWLDSANEIKWILGNLGSFVKKREGNLGSSNTYNWVIDILLFMFGMCLVYICAICCVFCLYWSGIWATSHFQINIHNLRVMKSLITSIYDKLIFIFRSPIGSVCIKNASRTPMS